VLSNATDLERLEVRGADDGHREQDRARPRDERRGVEQVAAEPE
jgi:hypothetical protein